MPRQQMSRTRDWKQAKLIINSDVFNKTEPFSWWLLAPETQQSKTQQFFCLSSNNYLDYA